MLMDEEEAARYCWEGHRKFFKNEITKKEKEILAKMIICDAHPFGDRTVCYTCDLQWDINDPNPPACRKAQIQEEKERKKELSDCKPEFHTCDAVYQDGGAMHCKTCDLKWDHWNRVPDDCKADQANKHLIKMLGCKAYEKENGFIECKHCEAKFLSEMKRPPQCIALQKLQATQKADHEQKPAAIASKLRMGRYEKTAADIMADMIKTYNERSVTYGHNFEMVGELVKILFPQGVPSELVVTQHWHLFELVLTKLSRFATSHLKHIDSIHDASVYGAIIEMILTQDEVDRKKKSTE